MSELTAEQWAESRAVDLAGMSDPESAATAAHFIAKVAKKPGSREEVATFSRAGRACPDILNRAVASVDRDRARSVKSQAKLAAMESKWREERAKSVQQDAKIMRLKQRVEELEKDNKEVRAAHQAGQGNRDKEVAVAVRRAKVAETAKENADRANAKKLQESKSQVRNLKLKLEVDKNTYRANKHQMEAELSKLKEQLQTVEDAASASDEIHNKKIGDLKNKVAAMEADAEGLEKKAAESEAAANSLRLKLVKAQLKVRAADQRSHELRRAEEDVARYERHCRRMTELYGGQIIISAYKESSGSVRSAAGAAGGQAGSSSRRRSAASKSVDDIMRSAIQAATAGVENQGLDNDDDEVTVIAIRGPLAGVAANKRKEAAGAKRPPKPAEPTVRIEDLTTEPESD